MENLGKVKIEYKDNNDIIQLYNAADVCSLVINGEVVDQYRELVASRFELKGSIKREDRIIPVSAKMGFFFMELFYDGRKVGKKFMAFG